MHPEPFAAASTAQVHHATLHTGERVVIKVQRPNIGPKINADLEILGDLLHTLQGRINWMQENDVLGIFGEFAKNLREEIDYRIESFNARRLEDNMTVFPEVKVPKMYGHLTTAKVLTMEYVQGVKIIKVSRDRGRRLGSQACLPCVPQRDDQAVDLRWLLSR
ncbi:MAG: AarF/ABC1/UbiB kinase family protein [Anaerolineales bacterium]|nr:AarF/ABC1/UbiB kinase family protein [Anaerolineales bacterium]